MKKLNAEKIYFMETNQLQLDEKNLMQKKFIALKHTNRNKSIVVG
jgi:hypothetical protein